jgi:hypothetical protein
MSRHATGVDTRVRTSSTCDADFLAQQQRQTVLQFALHRDAIGLDLPTMILRSVVTKPDKVPHNSPRRYEFFSEKERKLK